MEAKNERKSILKIFKVLAYCTKCGGAWEFSNFWKRGD